MICLASIIKQYENDLIGKYHRDLLPGHYKAMDAIKKCRSRHSPKMLMQCENDDCSYQEFIPHLRTQTLSTLSKLRNSKMD